MAALRAGASLWQSGHKKFLLYDGPPGGRLEHGYLLTAGRGYDRAQVMAVGDNWNDKEMLEFAGLPVVMANSSEELKQEGWAVTRSNDESGVAAAIEKFLLTD